VIIQARDRKERTIVQFDVDKALFKK